MSRAVLRRRWWLMGLAVALCGAYCFWPRQAHLRAFDPAAVARLETAMWRNYYERSYASLIANLYSLSRDE